MRETRLSGSEGGGNRDHSVLPTPILLFEAKADSSSLRSSE
jgi:hypothetical protein